MKIPWLPRRYILQRTAMEASQLSHDLLKLSFNGGYLHPKRDKIVKQLNTLLHRAEQIKKLLAEMDS